MNPPRIAVRAIAASVALLLVVPLMSACTKEQKKPLYISTAGPSAWPADQVQTISVTISSEAKFSGCRVQMLYEDPKTGGRTTVSSLSSGPVSSVPVTSWTSAVTYSAPGWLPPGSYFLRGICDEGLTSNAVPITLTPRQQQVTWTPATAVVATPSAGGYEFTPSAAATTAGDGAVTYAISSAGTAGCTLGGSRADAIVVQSNGTCEVTATAAGTALFVPGTATVSFTVTGVITTAPPENPVPEPATSSTPTNSYSCPSGSRPVTDPVTGRTFCELIT